MATANEKTTTVELSAIDGNDKTFQVRQSKNLNTDHVEGLVNSSMTTWQPLYLKQISGEPVRYCIVSGFHRYEAAKQIKDAKTIEAVILPSGLSDIDLKLTAYKLNSEHGMPLTMAEKKQHAVLLHQTNPALADYKIAAIVHISDKTVRAAIEEDEAEQKKLNAASTDETDETKDVEEETEDDASNELSKVFKSFASSLRKVSNKGLSLVDEKQAALLLASIMKKPGNEDDASDVEILQEISLLISDTLDALKPKPVKKAPAKKAPAKKASVSANAD